MTCSAEDYATDDDDWCVRVNYDEEAPRQTTVKIRECLGEHKVFCEWGIPGLNQKMLWPFTAQVLADSEPLDLFGYGYRYEARCIKAN